MTGRRGFIKYLFAVWLAGVLIAAAFWLGIVPQRFSPFAPLDLSEPAPWFLDLRLAALKSEKTLCQAVLKEPFIAASHVPDQPYENGCGWRNAVRLSQVGGAHLSAGQLSCPMAAALAMWITHEVQPAAEATFGAKVVAIRHMGTYACRNIVGSRTLKPFRSQHATANAIDISGFILADGRKISVLNHWNGEGANTRFLKSIKEASCRYFRVSIGPDFNDAHANHFHFDRGAFKSCR
ncbi:MAG: extensin family protein [Hyphomicrobiaceae bacterium]